MTIQLAICDESLGLFAILFIMSFCIFIVTFTLTYRHNETLKINKYKGWRIDQRRLWFWNIALWIALIIGTLLPLLLMAAPAHL